MKMHIGDICCVYIVVAASVAASQNSAISVLVCGLQRIYCMDYPPPTPPPTHTHTLRINIITQTPPLYRNHIRFQ